MKMLLFYITFILLSACVSNQVESDSFDGEIIDINPPLEIDVRNLISDYDTIRLEVTDKSLIRGISQLHVLKDKLYILNEGFDQILIFSDKGKFITNIKNIGSGPKEYIQINGFEVDPVHNKLLLTDTFSKRLFIYDEFGNQEKVISLDFFPVTIVMNDKGFVNFCSGLKNQYPDALMEDYNVHFLDEKGNFVFSEIEDETLQNIDLYPRQSVDCLEDGGCLYQPVLSDIIYSIKGHEVSSLYKLNSKSNYKLTSLKEKKDITFDFGGKNDFWEKEKEGYLLPWGCLLDLEKYVYINLSTWKNTLYLFYNKQNKTSFTIEPKILKGNGCLKTIFMDTPPRSSYKENLYVSPSLDMVTEYADKLEDGKLKTYINNTRIEDNPLLFVFSIKEPL